MRYPGSKAKLMKALMPHIDIMMLNRGEFCDAFIGGGSVLLEVADKYPKIKLYANDKDINIASFWKIISAVDTIKLWELFDLIDAKPTIEQFYKLRETPATNDVECAYRAIYFNRCCFSGIAMSGPIGGKEQKSKYTVDCRYNAGKLKKKIRACHELLIGRTEVSNIDFSLYDPLNKTDMPVYIDPPYWLKGKMLYPENMQPTEHRNLAAILNMRSNWILSYDDCPEIRNLYSKNQIIDLAASYCINGKKTSWEKKNELIILP